jgi:molybdenum cofactor cytidylyltransferase
VKIVRAAQIVLAAGRSRRMGSPKALLDFDGRSALRLVLEAAAAAGVETSVAVVGHGAEEVMSAHRLEGLGGERRWAVNPDEESEQIVSLQLGLKALAAGECEWFFIHPVDCPLAAAEDYRLLLEAAPRQGGGSPGREPAARVLYLSHARRRGHPVLCHGSLAAELLALGPAATARDVLERQPVAYVLTPNAGVLADMDTPEDYRRLVGIYRALRA